MLKKYLTIEEEQIGHYYDNDVEQAKGKERVAAILTGTNTTSLYQGLPNDLSYINSINQFHDEFHINAGNLNVIAHVRNRTYFRHRFVEFLQKIKNDPDYIHYSIKPGQEDLRKTQPEKAAIKMENFFGKEGTKLYQLALLEEINSIEYIEALVDKSTKEYVGNKWLERPIIIIGGPSGSGKSYAADIGIKQSQAYIDQLDVQNISHHNYVISVDGGMVREVSQMRKLAIRAANDKGFTGIADLQDQSSILEKTKNKMQEYALQPDNPHGVVIPETFSKYLLGTGKEMLDMIADLPNCKITFCRIVGKDDDTFQKTVQYLQSRRAWKTNWSDTTTNFDMNSKEDLSESKADNPNGFAFGAHGSNAAAEHCKKVTKGNYIDMQIFNDLVLKKQKQIASGEWIVEDANSKDKDVILISKRLVDEWNKTDKKQSLTSYAQSKGSLSAEIKTNIHLAIEKVDKTIESEIKKVIESSSKKKFSDGLKNNLEDISNYMKELMVKINAPDFNFQANIHFLMNHIKYLENENFSNTSNIIKELNQLVASLKKENELRAKVTHEYSLSYQSPKVSSSDLKQNRLLNPLEKIQAIKQALINNQLSFPADITTMRFTKKQLREIGIDSKYNIIVAKTGNDFKIYSIYKGVKHDKHLGTGSYGSVKLVQDELGGFYAYKVQSMKSEQKKKQLIDENDKLATAGQLVGSFTYTPQSPEKLEKYGNMAFATMMELIPGEPVDNFLTADIAPAELMKMSLEMAKALDNVHQKHLIHADVKPGNVIYDPQTQTAQWIDYGVSLRSDANGQAFATYRGSPIYMAPEIRTIFYQGEQNKTIAPENKTAMQKKALLYSSKTDVYSLGITIAQILKLADKEYPEKPIADIPHYKILSFNKETPHSILPNPTLREEVTNFLLKMTATSPKDRPEMSQVIIFLADMQKKMRMLPENQIKTAIVDANEFIKLDKANQKILINNLLSYQQIQLINSTADISEEKMRAIKIQLENSGLFVRDKIIKENINPVDLISKIPTLHADNAVRSVYSWVHGKNVDTNNLNPEVRSVGLEFGYNKIHIVEEKIPTLPKEFNIRDLKPDGRLISLKVQFDILKKLEAGELKFKEKSNTAFFTKESLLEKGINSSYPIRITKENNNYTLYAIYDKNPGIKLAQDLSTGDFFSYVSWENRSPLNTTSIKSPSSNPHEKLSVAILNLKEYENADNEDKKNLIKSLKNYNEVFLIYPDSMIDMKNIQALKKEIADQGITVIPNILYGLTAFNTLAEKVSVSSQFKENSALHSYSTVSLLGIHPIADIATHTQKSYSNDGLYSHNPIPTEAAANNDLKKSSPDFLKNNKI